MLLAAPLGTALFITSVVLALMNRAVPQMNLISMGFNLRVAVGLHVVPGLLDAAVLVDQEGGADHPGRRLSVEQLLAVGAVSRRHLVAGICQQLELEPELAAKTTVALRIVRRDAHDVDPMTLEGGQLVVELARLLRAAWRVVLGIEVDDDLAASIRGQVDLLAVLVGQHEGRGFVSGLQLHDLPR